MSIYAYVYNNEIIEFKEISDTLYSTWISENNPKKDSYKLVVYTQQPTISSNEVADYTFIINQTTVNQVWSIRNKTQNELQHTWTAYEFLNRFTSLERGAIRAAALSDNNVADFQMLAMAAQEITSNDPVTVAGMDYLVSLNIITAQRKTQILGE